MVEEPIIYRNQNFNPDPHYFKFAWHSIGIDSGCTKQQYLAFAESRPWWLQVGLAGNNYRTLVILDPVSPCEAAGFSQENSSGQVSS